MSWMGRLEQARAEAMERRHPWLTKIEDAVRGVESMSSAALLDLIGVRATTGNARRLAAAMRELKFVPLKSRRFLPGGFGGTTVRGWTRPMRSDARQRNSGRLARPEGAEPLAAS